MLPNPTGKNSTTTVEMAIEANDIPALILLLSQGTKLSRANLKQIANQSRWELAAYIVKEHDAASSFDWGDLLLLAAQHNQEEIALALLKIQGLDLNWCYAEKNEKNEKNGKYAGYFALHFAIENKLYTLLEALLKQESTAQRSVLYQSQSSLALALKIAIEANDIPALRLLLSQGTKLSRANLKQIANQSRWELAAYIVKEHDAASSFDWGDLLLLAAQHNQEEIALALLKIQGLDLNWCYAEKNEKNEKNGKYAGYFALHFAIENKLYTLLEALLKQESTAQRSVLYQSQSSLALALKIAIEANDIPALRLLLSQGTKLSRANLKQIANQSRWELAAYIVKEHDAASSFDWGDLLLLAAQHNQEEIALALLKIQGLDLNWCYAEKNEKNEKNGKYAGYFALHFAIENKLYTLLEALLKQESTAQRPVRYKSQSSLALALQIAMKEPDYYAVIEILVEGIQRSVLDESALSVLGQHYSSSLMGEVFKKQIRNINAILSQLGLGISTEITLGNIRFYISDVSGSSEPEKVAYLETFFKWLLPKAVTYKTIDNYLQLNGIGPKQLETELTDYEAIRALFEGYNYSLKTDNIDPNNLTVYPVHIFKPTEGPRTSCVEDLEPIETTSDEFITNGYLAEKLSENPNKPIRLCLSPLQYAELKLAYARANLYPLVLWYVNKAKQSPAGIMLPLLGDLSTLQKVESALSELLPSRNLMLFIQDVQNSNPIRYTLKIIGNADSNRLKSFLELHVKLKMEVKTPNSLILEGGTADELLILLNGLLTTYDTEDLLNRIPSAVLPPAQPTTQDAILSIQNMFIKTLPPSLGLQVSLEKTGDVDGTTCYDIVITSTTLKSKVLQLLFPFPLCKVDREADSLTIRGATETVLLAGIQNLYIVNFTADLEFAKEIANSPFGEINSIQHLTLEIRIAVSTLIQSLANSKSSDSSTVELLQSYHVAMENNAKVMELMGKPLLLQDSFWDCLTEINRRSKENQTLLQNFEGQCLKHNSSGRGAEQAATDLANLLSGTAKMAANASLLATQGFTEKILASFLEDYRREQLTLEQKAVISTLVRSMSSGISDSCSNNINLEQQIFSTSLPALLTSYLGTMEQLKANKASIEMLSGCLTFKDSPLQYFKNRLELNKLREENQTLGKDFNARCLPDRQAIANLTTSNVITNLQKDSVIALIELFSIQVKLEVNKAAPAETQTNTGPDLKVGGTARPFFQKVKI